MTWEDILKIIGLIVVCVISILVREADYKTLRYMRDKFLRK